MNKNINMPNKYFVVLSCQRNGSHCVANWLLHQKSGIDKELHMDQMREGIDAWQIVPTNVGYVGVLFNNLKDSEKEIASYHVGGAANVVSLYETGRSFDIRKIKPTERITKYFNIEQTRYVVVLRDFRNFAASIYFKHQTLQPQLVDWWTDRAKVVINLENQPNNYYFINYNKWFLDKEYRRKICDDLELDFTDKGYSTIPHFGGGSSFHGREFDGKTEMMEVMSRYRYYEHHEHFNNIMRQNKTVCDISDFLFGKPGQWRD